jgi:hypothetical protein
MPENDPLFEAQRANRLAQAAAYAASLISPDVRAGLRDVGILFAVGLTGLLPTYAVSVGAGVEQCLQRNDISIVDTATKIFTGECQDNLV